MIQYTTCPICNSLAIAYVHDSVDFTVSKKKFSIWECHNCFVRFTQNVPSQQEIGPYYKAEAYVSHTNTQKGLINKIYHKVRNYTLKSKRKLIQHETNLSKGNILDIGCGTGAFLNEMKSASWNITGLEPDKKASKMASKLYGINTQNPEVLFQLPKNSYDAITMWHVLEHVHQLHEYIKALHDLIKDNGSIFIAVPNYTSYDASHYEELWAAYDVPRHLFHFSPQSMEVLLNKYGLKLKSIQPMWFDSFYVSMLSQHIKNKRGNIIMAFIIGVFSNINAYFDKKKCSSVIYVVEKKV
jgi:2-polyprenyl-3-methyl-5-hydroxy-6-metoxy-1,4-benzoquinol methylase